MEFLTAFKILLKMPKIMKKLWYWQRNKIKNKFYLNLKRKRKLKTEKKMYCLKGCAEYAAGQMPNDCHQFS